MRRDSGSVGASFWMNVSAVGPQRPLVSRTKGTRLGWWYLVRFFCLPGDGSSGINESPGVGARGVGTLRLCDANVNEIPGPFVLHHQVKPRFHQVAVVTVVVTFPDALIWIRGAALLFDPCLQHASKTIVFDGGVAPMGHEVGV